MAPRSKFLNIIKHEDIRMNVSEKDMESVFIPIKKERKYLAMLRLFLPKKKFIVAHNNLYHPPMIAKAILMNVYEKGMVSVFIILVDEKSKKIEYDIKKKNWIKIYLLMVDRKRLHVESVQKLLDHSSYPSWTMVSRL